MSGRIEPALLNAILPAWYAFGMVAAPQLVGASLSSTFVTLDASQPSGIAGVANAVTTTIAAP